MLNNSRSEPLFDLGHHRETLWADLESQARRLCEDPKNDSLSHDVRQILDTLKRVERFWAYPGLTVWARLESYADQGLFSLFSQLVNNVISSLSSADYRFEGHKPFQSQVDKFDTPILSEENLPNQADKEQKQYFEVLVVHPLPDDYRALYEESLSTFKTERDEFVYDLVFVDNAEDALLAVLANPMIQACVVIDGFRSGSLDKELDIKTQLSFIRRPGWESSLKANPTAILPQLLRSVRAELNLYMISLVTPIELDPDLKDVFDKILFHLNPFQDLHFSILNGIQNRFSTPFFNALQAYSRKPKGVFHALPLSRGKSISNSHWIRDMMKFYGTNIFLAETSSTQKGLDSLLDPKGTIKQSHDKAAKTFGSHDTFFVTNGTSTSNKIVMQSLLCPGDIVLVSSDCHKSISYSVLLSGAFPIFLETFPMPKFDMYGAVPLKEIKRVMLELKEKKKLHLLKSIILTNSTFDGLIYNTERFMQEILAIKSDIIFHWDEAWFAYAHFNPLYQGRSAMHVAKKLKERWASPEYAEFYAKWAKSNASLSDAEKLETQLFPSPQESKLRVYATQSTHKTLTSFRQGSMIHIFDDYVDLEQFLEAFRMHSSTSPNYQILASLDLGRRQVALEGYECTKRCIQLGMKLRWMIESSDKLKPFFKVLNEKDLMGSNSEVRKTKPGAYDYPSLVKKWGDAEFVVDPIKVTLDVTKTGMDGSSFKQLLMNKYDIQVNKTTMNTVLLIVNIGTAAPAIQYLYDVLIEISERIRMAKESKKGVGRPAKVQQVQLPQKRQFFGPFSPFPMRSFEVSDIRKAFFIAYDETKIEFVKMDTALVKDVLNGRNLVSATFVTPYPPGFPILVPGQVITYDILLYLQMIKIGEIHGFRPKLGLKVFRETVLATLKGEMK